MFAGPSKFPARRWRVHGAFGDLEIEIHPGSVDGAEGDASVREVAQLVYDFKYRGPEAQRAVLSILARLGCLDQNIVHGPACDFDTGSPRAQAFGDELVRGSSGVIIARRRQVRSIVVPLDAPGPYAHHLDVRHRVHRGGPDTIDTLQHDYAVDASLRLSVVGSGSVVTSRIHGPAFDKLPEPELRRAIDDLLQPGEPFASGGGKVVVDDRRWFAP